MPRNIQMSIDNDKAYPYTIPEAVLIDTGSGIETLKDKLASIEAVTSNGGEVFTLAYKLKLDGIEALANKYVHPSTHPASIITQDAYNRFVTDAQISNWDALVNNINSISSGSVDQAKAYTDMKIADLLASAPDALNTLNELAKALNDDPNFATTLSQQLGLKASTLYVNEELVKKYDKTGGLVSGQIQTTIGANMGIKFSNNYLTSMDGTNLVALGLSGGIRFTDGTDWDVDQWGAIKYSNATKTVFIGGPAGSEIPDGGSATSFNVDMTLANAGVAIVKTDKLAAYDQLETPLVTSDISGTSKYRVKADTTSKLLEIATGDAAYAPIMVRQYSDNGFATLARTLTLLDATGNTTLPGKLNGVTGNFTGIVTVPTAATATNTTQIASTAFVNNFVGSKKINLDQLHSSTTITANTNTVNINIPTFDNTLDILMVYKNGLIVTDDDFVLNGNTSITSKDAVNGFVASVSQPAVFTFVVIKASIQ